MINAAIILDKLLITKWQKECLEETCDLLNIKLVLSCQNTRTKKRYFKNFAYYALNFFSLKNFLTQKYNFDLAGASLLEFDSIYDGNWQSLPENVQETLRKNDIKIVVKFGMSLLKVDENLTNIDILSFHHGDPQKFRGRPAGFYEIHFKESKVGTIVQSISNELDAGKIWALSHSKIYHHSYKKTALSFYSNSKYVFRNAILNYIFNRPINIECKGKNYRLPSNFTVIKFLINSAFRKLSRFYYGMLYEKKWNIVTFNSIAIDSDCQLELKDGEIPKILKEYAFYADPFYSSDGQKIRLEAMRSSTGLGEIIELNSKGFGYDSLLLKGQHYSYPFSFGEEQEEVLIPEVASHSTPYFLTRPFSKSKKNYFLGLEDINVVDGTVFKHGNVYYFFCGLKSTASDCLFLYHSSSLTNEFCPHPLNPIVIDPSRARMGGRVMVIDGKVYRFGQDNSFGYGNGLTISEIVCLSEDAYQEKVVGRISFSDASGPHTIDVKGTDFVLDFYLDRFSPLAGYRRLLPILQRILKRR